MKNAECKWCKQTITDQTFVEVNSDALHVECAEEYKSILVGMGWNVAGESES